MALPVSYVDKVTTEHSYRGLFPVDNNFVKKFVQEIEKISKQISGKLVRPDSFLFAVGCITFRGIKVSLKEEDRLDVVLLSNCGNNKISMHLADAKSSNSQNAFFINTWIKYIKSSLK